MDSLKAKINRFYRLLGIAALLLGIIALLNLLLLEQQINEHIAASRLQHSIQQSQWLLLLSIGIISLLILRVGRKLQQLVVNPLQQLERNLAKIANGEFQQLISPSNDQEFTTFTNAFNRMLKELEHRQKRILQTDKLTSLGILSAGVAHELNNPLSNISTSCQLLQEELEQGNITLLQKWLNQIDTETLRGQKIIRTMLDFGSQQTLEKTTHNLIDIIYDTRILIASAIKQYQAKLIINIPAQLSLDLDKQRIQQMFINLIHNALHAGGQGVEIKISALLCQQSLNLIPNDAEVAGKLTCTDIDQHFIEILVSDNGKGIQKDHLSKIFDPFYTTSEPGEGVGLGLFIVQEIIKEHGGCLAITSRENKGTKIIILLPLEQPNHA